MNQYLHDATNRIVYQVSDEPTVVEQTSNRGLRTGCTVRMEIRITRADNKLVGTQWQHATSAYPTQTFGPHWSKEQAISFFLNRHTPQGIPITREQFDQLQSQYEAIAQQHP